MKLSDYGIDAPRFTEEDDVEAVLLLMERPQLPVSTARVTKDGHIFMQDKLRAAACIRYLQAQLIAVDQVLDVKGCENVKGRLNKINFLLGVLTKQTQEQQAKKESTPLADRPEFNPHAIQFNPAGPSGPMGVVGRNEPSNYDIVNCVVKNDADSAK